jgi:hypothetical protein
MADDPTDFKDCVSKGELNTLVQQQNQALNDMMARQNQTLNDIVTRMNDMRASIANLVTRVNDIELRDPQEEDASDNDDPNAGHEDDDAGVFVGQDWRAQLQRRPNNNNNNRNHRMGGNVRGNDDHYAKVKFKIPSFDGSYDADAYLDWEMTVEQKFNSHMVPDIHRVRQATSEFTNYAIIWWNGLVNAGLEPTTWERLKHAMRSRFIPPEYKRDLKKKLQRFNQGSRSVNEYYNELHIAVLRCGIQENDEDTMIHFYSGLRREIQDLVDYRDYNTMDRLFHLAMLAEKELQGREPKSRNIGSSFSSRSQSGKAKSASFAPARSAAPSDNRARTAAPSPPAPHTTEVSKSVSVQQPATKTTPSTGSTSSSASIVCRRCKGMGHVMKDCPSQRAYVATDDGGYISTSDVEDEFVLQANLAGDHETDSDGDEILGAAATEDYKNRTFVVQRVLSAQMEQAEQLQRHNLFQMFLIVKDCRVRVIIDGGSCNNLVSSDFVKKLGLATRAHPRPYHIQWLNNSGKAKVTHTVRVHFSIGSYHDYADCDVVPMQACSLLLGRPWEFDTNATHHGRSNKYTLMHKGKKITLLPLTPSEIVQCDKAIAENAKREQDLQSENQQVAKHVFPPKKEQPTPSSSSTGIKLKGGVMLVTKSDLAEIVNNDVPCYALVCKEALFSLDDIPSSLPSAVTNLLQEYKDVFPTEIPPGLPPLRGIEHQIDLILGATLPNCVAYRTNPEETKEIQ